MFHLTMRPALFYNAKKSALFTRATTELPRLDTSVHLHEVSIGG
jgi:hypothetical protein